MGAHTCYSLIHLFLCRRSSISCSCITNTPISRQNLQMFYHIKSPTDSLHGFINTNCPAFIKRPLSVNTQFLLVTAAEEALRCSRKSLTGQKCFVDVAHSCHTDLNVFQKHNYFLGESSDLRRVKAVIRGANQCHNVAASWIWIKQIQLGMWGGDLIKVFYHITPTYVFQQFPRTDQSSTVLSHRRWRLAGVGSETRGTWRLKKQAKSDVLLWTDPIFHYCLL